MKLAPQLKNLVHQTVALLGEVIRAELGVKAFQQIEEIRQKMTQLRDSSTQNTLSELEKVFQSMSRLRPEERLGVARSFTLMLELMNACENAYRSHRLTFKTEAPTEKNPLPSAIIYVLTAHPTEARSPKNIAIFHQIQGLLIQILSQPPSNEIPSPHREDLRHLLEMAWRVHVVRDRKPKVKDEADHIYSMLFRDSILFALLDQPGRQVPVYFRTWVGGDKDGHPGVDEKVLFQSLSLSRLKLTKLLGDKLKEVNQNLKLLHADALSRSLNSLLKKLSALKVIRRSDASRVQKFKAALHELRDQYIEEVGEIHPELRRLCQLLETFPGLVVPLELRESSDVLTSKPAGSKELAIVRMLFEIAKISEGGDPRWYARGFIISMTESLEHILSAAHHQKKVFGEIRLPIIPLFEEAVSLRDSKAIVQKMISHPEIRRAILKRWNGLVEMMVGYSDSSKESGALASRLAIASALPKLERVCLAQKMTPVFFHGSGGSVDRGGGSIEEQTAWWPRSALNRYKVTIQGEMVERSMATPEIAQSQIEKIISSAGRGLKRRSHGIENPVLTQFAKTAATFYHAQITSEKFLSVVEGATPYSYLNILKIGSRPAKRTARLTVAGLRAIPWVLCWTQTRVLMQTWWGVGSAWEKATNQDKQILKKAFQNEPVFQSYVKALGFTLSKVNLAVWKMYLDHSNLTEELIEEHFHEISAEYDKTLKFYRQICGKKDLMWFRPWLGESIQLRSPMIHPLNLLQILAQKEKDFQLLRLTVTGISSGMLTTG